MCLIVCICVPLGYLSSVVGHLDYEDTMSYQLTIRASDIFTGNFAEALVNITVEVNYQNIQQFKFLIIIAMNPYIFKNQFSKSKLKMYLISSLYVQVLI